MNKTIICFSFLYAFLVNDVCAQSYNIDFNVNGQPQGKVVLGSLRGDDFVAIDSLQSTDEHIHFSIAGNAHAGMYRVIFGQTTYAQVMKKAPQQLDFIFNKENVVLATDFKYPEDSLKVIHSNENALWFLFRDYEKRYKKQYTILEEEMDLFWANKDTIKALDKSNDFNRLQMARDLFIGQKVQQNKKLLAVAFIAQYRQPILDGFLTPEERKADFQRNYFKTVDFSDERLINSSVYTDKVFEYLVTYNDKSYTKSQRESAYIKAVDDILQETNQNEKVQQFIIGYLIHGFKLLHLDKVIAHIHENQK